MGGELGGLDIVVLGSVAIPANSVVCPCRWVLVSAYALRGEGILHILGWSLFRRIDVHIFPWFGRVFHGWFFFVSNTDYQVDWHSQSNTFSVNVFVLGSTTNDSVRFCATGEEAGLSLEGQEICSWWRYWGPFEENIVAWCEAWLKSDMFVAVLLVWDLVFFVFMSTIILSSTVLWIARSV